MDFNMIATTCADLPKHYIANIPVGQDFGHPRKELDYHCCLQPEVLYNAITKQYIDLKRANCVEARAGHILGNMSRQSTSNSLEKVTISCALVVVVTASPTQSLLKSASVEVLNWNLRNEYYYDKDFFATILKDKVCVCGCHGRHTIDSTFGHL